MARSVKGPTSNVVEGTVAWFSPDDDRWPDTLELTYDGQQKQRVVIPTNLAGGDYSDNDGGLVRANYNVFTEEFADLEDTYWWRISSGFGGFGVCVSEDAWAYAEEHGDEDEQAEVVRMLEALNGLASYPYLPGAEEEESDVQMNAEIESWNDYGYREFRDALFGVLFSEDEEKLAETFEEALDAQEDQGRGILAAVYRGLGDLFSIYPEFEGSGDNIAPVYQFDSWAERLASLLSAWEQPGEENHLRLKILDDVIAGNANAFLDHRGEIYKVASWTKDKLGGAIVAKAAAIPVVQDWIATQGGGAGAWSAILGGAKFSGVTRTTARLNPQKRHESVATREMLWPWRHKVLEAVRQVYPTYPIATFEKRFDLIFRMLEFLAEINVHPGNRSEHALKLTPEPFDVEDARDLVLRGKGWMRLAEKLFAGHMRTLGLPREQVLVLLNAEGLPGEDTYALAGLIPGGRPAGDRPDSDFDPIQLRKGINVEMEHTSDRRVAKEIAKAHLTERPDYYALLERMEVAPRLPGFAGRRVAVSSKDGPMTGELLATFTSYVQGEGFQFIIVKLDDGTISLTYKANGKRIAVLEPVGLLKFQLIDAGKAALAALIAKYGEARVRGVLAGAA